MKLSTVIATRVSLALGLVMSVGIASVAAATPSSSLKALPDRTSTRSVTLSYVMSGDGGTISKVELYAKKDDGAFRLIDTALLGSNPFVVDFSAIGGDGRYAFHTIAYLKNDTETTFDDVAETGKDLLEETATIVDTVAPPAPDASHIYINQAASLNVNEISGYAKGVEGLATVKVYSDSGLTTLITTVTAKADGSFGPTEIGSTANRPFVWLVAVDANGNRGVATLRENKLSYNATVGNLQVTPVSETALDVTYTAPVDATEYIVYYRHAGGSVWSAMVRTKDTIAHLTNLDAGRAYDVRVAPVDSSNSVGTYQFAAVRTSGTPLKDVVLVSEMKTPVTVTTATTSTTTAAATTTKAAEPKTATSGETTKPATPAQPAPAAEEAKPADQATPAANTAETPPADANATATENQPSSATPWVILAILIILAGIATGGYFYWFSGPEEVTTTLPEADTTKKEKGEEKKDEDVDKRW